jgi:outer membrane protein assembly factor BamA
VVRLNQLGYFNPIDKDKDADYRTNEEEALVDVTVKVSERAARRFLSTEAFRESADRFSAALLDEQLVRSRGGAVVDLAAGNRQRSFSFSFTEPYVKNRPSPRASRSLRIRRSFSVKHGAIAKPERPAGPVRIVN